MPANNAQEPSAWLILVKHAMPVVDAGKPAAQWQLSAQGREGCIRLAQWLRTYHPYAIFTSHEPKALETGQIVASLLNLPCEARPGLHEHLRPQAGLLSQQEFHASVSALFDHPSQVVFGAECADQAYARFSDAVATLLAEFAAHPGGLVIVSHGTVISLFTAARSNLPAYPIWQSLGLPSAVIFGRLPDGNLVDRLPRDMFSVSSG
jgi:broad specificity phosphatase PhoE